MFAAARSRAASATWSGSPGCLGHAMPAPGGSHGSCTCAVKTSKGSSMNTGPGTPLSAMRNPVRTYSPSRRGSLAVNEALVTADSSGV